MASQLAAVRSVAAVDTPAGGTAADADCPRLRQKPTKAAAATISGKGTFRKKMPTNAAPAISHSTLPLSARLATRSSASMTIASTAALTPTNTASASGSLPKAAYSTESVSTTSAPGSTNSSPAANPPLRPCRRQPT